MNVFELPKVQANPRAYGFAPYNHDITPRALGFAPDGQLLAVWDRGRMVVINTMQGTVHKLWDEGQNSMSAVPGVGFTADGSGVIAFHERLRLPNAADETTVEVHDINTGTVMREYTLELGGACEPGPDGRVVYIGVQSTGWPEVRCEIIPWDPLTGDKKPPFARHRGEIRQLAVSTDEMWFATSNLTEVRVWNPRSNKQPALPTRQFKSQQSGTIHAVALSSDGAYVAASGPGVNIWEIETCEYSEVAQRGRDHCREIAFHPSLPLLAFSGSTTEVAFWDAAAREEVKRFAWDIGEVTATAFSPDGLLCAAAGTGKVVVWDVDV
jgi:WD40 repeat protein